MADVTTTQAGGAQPTQDHNTSPGGTGTVPATTTTAPVNNTPIAPQETALMQQARARNEAMLAAQNGGVLNTQAGKTTIGDLYANGVRDKNAIGSFQNNGDQGTGGTSMTETGTGTTAKQDNIQNPMPLGQQQAIDLQRQQQTNQTQQPQQTQAQQQYASQQVSQSQRDSDMIFASEIRTAANEFGNKLDAFTGSFKNDMGEFLNNQTNSYSALVDQMSQFMQAQTGEIKALSDRQIATWDNLSKTFDVEKNAAIAETNQNAKTMTDFARLDEQMALKQNQLAQAQTAAQYADQIAVAQENQSRYLGFLAGKFDAAGMANSSAGVQLLGKYLAAGQAQINSLQRDADTAQQMYIAKGTDIINSFAKQAFQIEAQRQQDTRKLRQDANDRIMQIESNKFATEEKKLMDIYSITKDYNSMVMDAKSKAFSEIMQVKDQHLKEAQFAQTVIQDTIKNQQWEQSFKQGVFESDRTYGLQERQENRALDSQRTSETGNLWINGQDTGKRALPGLTYDKQIEQWNKTFKQGQYEFEKNYDLNSAQFDLQRQRFASEEDQKKFERDKAYAESTGDFSGMSKYKGEQSNTGGTQIQIENSKYTPTLQNDGSVRFNVETNNSGKVLNGRTQCGEFTNDCIGSKVFGDSIDQKRKQITTQIPTPGAAFVQSTGNQYGHVGMVENAYAFDSQGRPTKMDIVDSNYKSKGVIDHATISISYDASGNPTYTRSGKNVQIEGFTDSFTKQGQQKQVQQSTDAIKNWASRVQKTGSFDGVPPAMKTAVNNYLQSQPQGQSTPTFKNADDAKTWGYANRMTQAAEQLNAFDENGAKGVGSWWEMSKSALPLPNGMKGAALQLQDQAKRNFINAVLRRESGAAISPEEFKNAEEQYFPQPGDDAATVDAKRMNRIQATQDFYAESGQKPPMLHVKDKNGQDGIIPAYEFTPALYTKVQ